MKLHCPVCGRLLDMDKANITNITSTRIYFVVQTCGYCTDKIIDRLIKRIDDAVLNGVEEDDG